VIFIWIAKGVLKKNILDFSRLIDVSDTLRNKIKKKG